jgi:hypothetical protein
MAATDIRIDAVMRESDVTDLKDALTFAKGSVFRIGDRSNGRHGGDGMPIEASWPTTSRSEQRGYVSAEVDREGMLELRFRDVSGPGNPDDFVLREPPLRDGTNRFDFMDARKSVHVALARWQDYAGRAVVVGAETWRKERWQESRKIQTAVDSLMDAPGRSCALVAPTIHHAGMISSIGSKSVEIPELQEICDLWTIIDGDRAAMRRMDGSGVKIWSFMAPHKDLCFLKAGADPVEALRAFSVLQELADAVNRG